MKTRWIYAAACLLPACAGAPGGSDTRGTDTSDDIGQSSAALNGSGSASINVYSDTGTTFCANLVLINYSPDISSTWTAVLDMASSRLTSSWAGNFRQSGSTLTVTPAGNAAVPVDAKATPRPGFCGTRPRGTALPKPTDIRFQYCGWVYPDSDNDGYGVTSQGVYTCDPQPSGYVYNSPGDCCDSDQSTHPGQTAFFTTPNACGNFDYNCDGAATPQSNGPTDCSSAPMGCTFNGTACVPTLSPPPDCGGSFTSYGQAACGQTWYLTSKVCITGYPQQCYALNNGWGIGPQACN
jgi:hypothetical protein